ncbi:MAG: MerR family transcriptional regulator [Anaeromyxobacteraceae bacterium]
MQDDTMLRPHTEDLTSAEAADLLRVSAATVKRWADDGWLPSRRTRGGHRRFRRADVLEAEQRLLLRGGEPGGPIAERLAARDPVLRIQAELLGERARLGSWASVCDACIPVLSELTARHRTAAAPSLSLRISQNLLEAALSRCADELPVHPSAPVAVVAAVEDERYTLELAFLRLCLREAGWAAHAVGAASTADLASLVATGGLDALVLFASVARARAGLEPVVDRIAPACAVAGVALALAGRAWPTAEPPRARVVLSPGDVAIWVRELGRAGAAPAVPAPPAGRPLRDGVLSAPNDPEPDGRDEPPPRRDQRTV